MAPSKGPRSYSQQFADLKGKTDLSVYKSATPSSSQCIQAITPGAKLVPFSDGIYARKEDRPLMPTQPANMTAAEADRKLKQMYYQRYFGLIGMHAIAFLVSPSRTYSQTSAQPTFRACEQSPTTA